MKKNFVKKLALVMTMALAVSAVAPAANTASAATAPAFKSAKASLKVGETKKYNVANSGNYSLYKAVVGTKTIAKVVNGGAGKGATKYVKITGLKEGKTTVRAELKNYATKKVTAARISVVVAAATVETGMLKVVQTADNAFEATFGEVVKDKLTISSFEVKSTTGSACIPKTVEFSADGKTAIVTVYNFFTDGSVYNVTSGEKTLGFTAKVGKVASITLKQTTIETNVQTKLTYNLFDADGINVTESTNSGQVTFAVDSVTDGYFDGTNKLTLYSKGATATVTVTYDPLTYTNGTPDATVSATGTIVAADAILLAGHTYFSLAKDGDTYVDFGSSSFSSLNWLAVDDAGYSFVFVATDKDGNAINFDDIEITSSNEGVLVLGAPSQHSLTNADSHNDNSVYASVTALKAGAANVMVTCKRGESKAVYSFPITVKAKRVLASANVAASTVIVSSTSNNDDYAPTLSVTGADQYGDYISSSITDAKTGSSALSTITATTYTAPTVSAGGDKVTVADATSSRAGNYAYRVVVADVNDPSIKVERSFTVSVKEVPTTGAAATTLSYKVEVASSVDLAFAGWQSITDYNKTVRVAKYVGGIFDGYLSTTAGSSEYYVSAVSIKKANRYFNEDMVATGATAGAAGAAFTNNGNGTAEMTLAAIDSTDFASVTVTKNAAKATYQINVSLTKDGGAPAKSASANITYTNSQALPSVKVASSTVEVGNGIQSVLKLGGGWQLTAAYSSTDTDVTATVSSGMAANQSQYVKEIEVSKVIGGKTVTNIVSIGRTFVWK